TRRCSARRLLQDREGLVSSIIRHLVHLELYQAWLCRETRSTFPLSTTWLLSLAWVAEWSFSIFSTGSHRARSRLWILLGRRGLLVHQDCIFRWRTARPGWRLSR